MKYYIRARKKTGPDLIYELSAHPSKEEAEKAAEQARKSGKWEFVNVTTAPLQTKSSKPRHSSGRRQS